MRLKEEIKEKAISMGFDLVGVSDLKKVEELEALLKRGLKPPSKIFPGAKSLLILGVVIWDEAMNLSISNARADSNNEVGVYYNMYYEITETRAWRLIRWLSDEKGVSGVPTHKIQLKPAAMLAGLGFIGHNTQVVTEKYGPRVRFVGVLLNEEIAPDEPYSRDLCKEQKLCQERSLCVKACPYNAIIPGPSMGVPFGEKVLIDKCVVFHLPELNLEKRWEKFSRRVTDRGFLECTLCNLVCPYGKTVEEKIIPQKRGITI
jgi:epoxyqueuosine reductase